MTRNSMPLGFLGNTNIAYSLPTALFLLLFFIGMTTAVDWKFSVDLKVLQDVIAIYPFTDEPLLALADNSAIIWLALQAPNFIDTNILLKLIYVVAFIFKTILLLRYFGVIPAISFTLLFFFAIDLNQARLSLAISLLLVAWSCSTSGKLFFSLLLVTAGIVCHYPGAIVIAFFYLIARNKAISIYIFAGLLVSSIVIFADPDSPALRYLAYFDTTGNDGVAMFFMVTALIVCMYWWRLSTLQRFVSVAATAMSFATRDLVNLSGRVSELVAIFVLLCAFTFNQRIRKERLIRSEIILLIGIAFFSYRFTQWVIMGGVPIPSNL